MVYDVTFDVLTLAGRTYYLVPVENIGALLTIGANPMVTEIQKGRQLEAPGGDPPKKQRAAWEARPVKGAGSAPAAAPPIHYGKAMAEPGDGSIRGDILAALKKAPRTSIELIELLKKEMGEISPACAAMKAQGRIEARENPETGRKAWYLVEKK